MKKIVCRSKADFKKIEESYPDIKKGCVAVLGFFDGVHIAHRALIESGRKKADELGISLVIFTFFGEDGGVKNVRRLIYSDNDKVELLSECGADAVVICSFSALSSLSGENFVNEILIDSLFTKVAVSGFNFRFGNGAKSSACDLIRFMEERGCSTLIVPELTCDEETISSTRIRNLLSCARMEEAARLLGSPYFISGEVTHGDGRGRGMGTPTVNTDIESSLCSIPSGVYLTAVRIENDVLPAVTNVGVCPTFGERDFHAETFILDFNGNLYNNKIRVYFLSFIRDEKTFLSENELKKQINIDIIKAKKLLKEIKWQEIGLNLR